MHCKMNHQTCHLKEHFYGRNTEKTDATLDMMGKYVDQISCLEQKIPTQVINKIKN